MRRATVVAAAMLACVAIDPAGAGADDRVPPADVAVQFSAYGPSQLDILPGQTVDWTNESQRTHTVTSDTGLFDSGRLPGGARFSFRFATVGTYRYHCTIHPSIAGEIDVRRVTLDELPTAAVPLGDRVELSGRSVAAAGRIRIQQRVGHGPFRTIASAAAGPDGSWSTTIRAAATGDVRALLGSDASETRRLLVNARHVAVVATRIGIGITVTPSAPYAPFLVERYERERFGWWPVVRGTTDYVSQAEVRIGGPARIRVVLVDSDGWTPLATSRTVVLRRR